MEVDFQCGRCRAPGSIEITGGNAYTTHPEFDPLQYCPVLKERLAAGETLEGERLFCPDMTLAAGWIDSVLGMIIDS